MDTAFKAILFDMDGVLVDSEDLIAEAGTLMLKERYGLSVHRDDFRAFVGMGESRYLAGVAARYGVTIRLPEDKVRTYEIYLTLAKGRLQPLPGVLDFITTCRKQGLPLAVATSADRIKLDGNLLELGLAKNTFDATVTGSEVTRPKPAPDLFLEAARRLGQEPADCLVLEDALSGIEAAHAAGMRCLAVATSFPASALREAGADWVFEDLSQIPSDFLVAP